jgi:hypothetical protein
MGQQRPSHEDYFVMPPLFFITIAVQYPEDKKGKPYQNSQTEDKGYQPQQWSPSKGFKIHLNLSYYIFHALGL